MGKFLFWECFWKELFDCLELLVKDCGIYGFMGYDDLNIKW